MSICLQKLMVNQEYRKNDFPAADLRSGNEAAQEANCKAGKNNHGGTDGKEEIYVTRNFTNWHRLGLQVFMGL